MWGNILKKMFNYQLKDFSFWPPWKGLTNGYVLMWWGGSFQNLLSSVSMNLDFFHDYIISWLLFILILTSGFFYSSLFGGVFSLFVLSSGPLHKIEFFWTALPIFILLAIGVPSMFLLYASESSNKGISMNIKGNQWYWSYVYPEFENVEFDSYLKQSESLVVGEPRMMETDNRCLLPFNTTSGLFISSSDVLHAWSLPACGIKMDANPGLINFIFMKSMFPGVFYGQCSEICGANHSFMPICLELTSPLLFRSWLKSF